MLVRKALDRQAPADGEDGHVGKTRMDCVGAAPDGANDRSNRQRHHRDEKAVNLVQPGTVFPPPTAFRTITILHVAMFDAVNSIEARYKPYKVQLPASPDTSKEAAAAAAAAAVLIKLVPDSGSDIQSTLTTYLATLPDGEAKSKGIELGQEVAMRILEARANDGASAPDA